MYYILQNISVSLICLPIYMSMSQNGISYNLRGDDIIAFVTESEQYSHVT